MEINPSCIFFYCLKFISLLNLNVPNSHSSWEVSVLGGALAKASGHCLNHCISCTNPEMEGKGVRIIFMGFFFQSGKRPLTWWPITNYHLLLSQELNRGFAFPVLPLLLLASIGVFSKPCFRWKCNSLAWMNTDIDLSKLLSHFKLSDS